MTRPMYAALVKATTWAWSSVRLTSIVFAGARLAAKLRTWSLRGSLGSEEVTTKPTNVAAAVIRNACG